MSKKRNIIVKKLYRLTRKLAQIEEDWDVDLEEKIIEEQSAWEERGQAKKELEEDKRRRIEHPTPGWEATQEDVGAAFMNKLDWLKDSYNDSGIMLYVNLMLEDGLVEFLLDNEEVLDKIVKSHGGDTPEYLGSGVEGSAWELGDGTVLKIFKGEPTWEYEERMKEIYSKKPQASHEIMIHEKGKFKTRKGGYAREIPISWVVVEKTIPILSESDWPNTSNLTKIVQAVDNITGRYEDTLIEIIEQRGNDEAFEFAKAVLKPQVLERIERFYYSEYIRATREEDLADDWLDNFIDQIFYQHAHQREDTHAGNVGIRPSTGYLVFYDA